MKTVTMKLPESLASWLEAESKRIKRPKSAVIRDILEEHQSKRGATALDLAADLCGSAQSGLGDLSVNKKRLKGFGR